MFKSTKVQHRFAGALGGVVLLLALGLLLGRQNPLEMAYATGPAREMAAGPMELAGENQADAAEPWTSAQAQQPAELAKMLALPKSKRPLIICVGFPFLYQTAHIPGALFHGPGTSPAGLEDLKKWAQNVPRSQAIVLYCGCCPWNRCPNIRPAFKALREMGFTQLKVLSIDTDFPTDWVQKGFPVEKGK